MLKQPDGANGNGKALNPQGGADRMGGEFRSQQRQANLETVSEAAFREKQRASYDAFKKLFGAYVEVLKPLTDWNSVTEANWKQVSGNTASAFKGLPQEKRRPITDAVEAYVKAAFAAHDASTPFFESGGTMRRWHAIILEEGTKLQSDVESEKAALPERLARIANMLAGKDSNSVLALYEAKLDIAEALMHLRW